MSMDIYLIKTRGQSMPQHGPFVDSYKIYVPSPYSVIVEKGDNGKFFYNKDREHIRMAEMAVKGELENHLSSKIDVDVDQVTDLLGLGEKIQDLNNDFNKQAKPLFEIVMAGATK